MRTPAGLSGLRRTAIGVAAVLATTMALAAAATLVQSQTSPSIEIELSPHPSVPLNTAITGTVTLRGLDPDEYSSVIFRADSTQYKPASFPEGSDYLGADIDQDLVVDVDSSSEVFSISVFRACDLSIYAFFELDITLSKADANAPDGKITLATAKSRFSMSRYLEAGVPTATPPNPDAIGWMEPDPTTLDMTVHGDWHQFRFRADISRYLDHHVAVFGHGDVEGILYAPGANIPARTVEEACEQDEVREVNWRRAINQPLTIGACNEGRAKIRLNPYNDEVDILADYSFLVTSTRNVNPLPPPPPTSTPRPVPTPPPTSTPRPSSPPSSGGGFGGFGPAPVAPSFRDGFRASREVAENTPEGEPIGEPIDATHPDDLEIEYTMSGSDAALFDIDAETAQIRVGEGTLLDLDRGRNTYTVNVTATDTSGTGALIIVNIRVTEINMGPYDRNDNGKIERVEVLAAVSDYFKGLIDKEDVIQLIRLYFAN